MKSLLFSNLPHKFVALLIAGLLAAMVRLVDNPASKSFAKVPIRLVNLPEDLVILNPPEAVRVDAYVTGGQLVNIDEKDFEVRLDFRGASPGRAKYDIVVIPNERIKLFAKLEARPASFNLDLERFVTKPIRIRLDDVKFSGTKDGYRLGKYALEPELITVRGPETYVREAVAARVTVDLSKVEPAGVYEREIEILDGEGRPVRGVDADPRTVLFRATLEPLLPAKNVLIGPAWKGSPKIGYRITNCFLTPNQLRVRGDAELLATISMLDTEPIDVTELAETREYTVRVILPAGITADGGTRATVRVVVAPIPETPPNG
jgi:YbbR domain-containing protein